MDGLDTTGPEFGIENTMSVDTAGAGDSNLLNDLLSPETSTADPDGLSSMEDENNNANNGDNKPKPQISDKEGNDDVPESKTKSPEALTNFLLGGDDDDDENSNEEEEDTDDVDASTSSNNEDKEKGSSDNDDDDDDDSTTTANSEGSIAFDALAAELTNLGVFSQMEGDEDSPISTPEEFLERFKVEKERGAQALVSEFIGQFGPEHQEAFKAIYVDGANPRDYFSQAAKVEDFSGMDLSVESNQEKVVRQALQNQEFDPEDIDKEVERLKNYGDLEEVSKRHHKVLIKKEKEDLKLTSERAKQMNEAKQAAKASYINNVRTVLQEQVAAKEFDGIPLNAQTANELQDFLLVDKWKTESGETLTDFDKSILELKRPENHKQKVKVGLLLKLLEKDPTLSTIQKRGVSKKSSQLFKDVARQKTTSNRVVKKEQPASWFQK